MSAKSACRQAGIFAAGLLIGPIAMAGEAPLKRDPSAEALQGTFDADMARAFDASAQDMRERIRALADGDERAASRAAQSQLVHRTRYLELRTQKLRISGAAVAVRSPFIPDFSAQPVLPEPSVTRDSGARWDLYSSASRADASAESGKAPWGLYGSRDPGKASPRASSNTASPYLVYWASPSEDGRSP